MLSQVDGIGNNQVQGSSRELRQGKGWILQNSLVMRIIILSWMGDGNPYSVFIGCKDFHSNYHWRMESSSITIGSWKKRRPLIGRRDFNKLSLAKGKQAQGRVLKEVHSLATTWTWIWIWLAFACVEGKGFMVWRRFFCNKEMLNWGGGETVKIEQFCFFLESSIWIFYSKFKIF